MICVGKRLQCKQFEREFQYILLITSTVRILKLLKGYDGIDC